MFKQANNKNYAKGRTSSIKYIVIHYTANNGDTVSGNLNYFANNAVQASAHYFVDESGWGQSVKDTDTAWHCGAQIYKHYECRNPNSIAVELCSRIDSQGNYYFLDATVKNAANLVKQLMSKYNVDANHVLRHYDVTGKKCPAPMVDNITLWNNFLAMIAEKDVEDDMTITEVQNIAQEVYNSNKKIYNKLEEVPSYAKETIEKLMSKNILQGTGSGLNLNEDMIRILVINDRAGIYD
jgi:N-acetylmuramoyl-L-alanine amidase|uniref:N-acetylmuramoyl-L-alanine amidase n=1 Tax=Siphoviridae sp. ct0Wl9 TaxID=2827763 RepID=A0A8S5T9L6_9CAUD|nr:MAG TPA: N acetylmuramoyl L alanine amidase endolysin [Siphoviridae sp. ct0Wl9]